MVTQLSADRIAALERLTGSWTGEFLMNPFDTKFSLLLPLPFELNSQAICLPHREMYSSTHANTLNEALVFLSPYIYNLADVKQ